MSLQLESHRPLFNDKDRLNSSLTTKDKQIDRLPRIVHPSTKYSSNDSNSLNIRGKSSDGRNASNDDEFSPNEFIDETTSKSKQNPRRRRSSSFKSSNRNEENVRLPIFGYRPSSIASSQSDNPQTKGKETPRTSRFLLDEFEMIFKEKLRSQFNEIKTKFRHASESNDPDGSISRPALQHLIASIFGIQRQISPHQIDLLLERFQLKHSQKISFQQLISAVFRNDDDFDVEGRSSRQISSQRQRNDSSSKKSSTQMFLILKEKLRTKNDDLVRLCPSIIGGQPSRIFKAQFYNSILDMGYKMKDTEFDKLWDKFDTDGFKAIQSEKFLKRLTNESIGEETHRDSTPSSKKFSEEYFDDEEKNNDDDQHRTRKPSHQSSDRSTPRISTSRDKIDENQIQKWLNHKFPHGFDDFEKSLEKLDTKQTGNISRDRFLSELKRFGFQLESHLLDFFLKRLNVDLSLTNGFIPYRDVINAFKDQSDPTKKRLNADNRLFNNENRQSSLERQIEMCLAINYERIKSLFNRFDRNHSGTITTNEFRSIIEDLIDYTLKPDEFYQLLKSIPQDDQGKIQYNQYLKLVLDRALTRQEDEQNFSKTIEWNLIKPNEIRSKFNVNQIKRQRDSQTDEYDQPSVIDQDSTRSIDQLKQMLKALIRHRYKDIEEQFQKLDRQSYGELSKDLLFQLFRRLSVQPEVNRQEIDLIWSRCHLKENGHLDFYQFLREFGYSKGSAHYPNAKQNPPKRGDADFLLTSRKLYGDSVLVHTAALNAIRSNWNELRREFGQLDPHRTGFIQSDEFDDILVELCPSVNQDDLDLLKSKFQDQFQNRMNYIRFLRYHSPLPECLSLIDQSSSPSMNSSRLPPIQEHSPRIQSNHSVFSQISTKIRRKLSDSYKDLRRSFKEIDRDNSGSIRVKQFQDILHKYNCHLNDEQFYTLVSQLDTQMNGLINYNYFLQQYVKNT